jgi:hypothetical protein
MMATDPVQALIDAGAIPSSPFGPSSRYAGVPIGRYQHDASDPDVPYVLRRLPPRRAETATSLVHIVRAGERPDLLAAEIFGDPELYWQIADANAVTDPFELTDTLGARIRIPAPRGQ